MSSFIDRIRGLVEDRRLVIMTQVIKSRNARLTLTYTYGIFIVMAINILYLHDYVVGLTTLGISAALFGRIFYHVFYGHKQFGFEDVVRGAFIFLVGLSLVIAPFAIFGEINIISVAVMMLLVGIPISLYSASLRLKERTDSGITLDKSSLISFLIIASFVILLLVDMYILLGGRSDSFSWIWQGKILHSYIYSTFLISLAILPFILLAKVPVNTKLILVIIHTLMIELYIAMTVSTLPGSDNWYMIGEIRSTTAGDGDVNRLAPTTTVGSISVPQVLITGWSRGFSNGLVILLTAISQIDVYRAFAWIAPIFFSIFGTTLMYKIGKRVSAESTFGIIASLCFLIVSATVFREASTTKLSISYPFLILGLLTWVNYLLLPIRRNLALGIFVTALNFISYSLFFITLIQIGVMSVFLKNSAVIRPNKLVSIGLIMSLSVMVPLLDTLQDSKFSIDQFSSIQTIRTTIAERSIELSGINGPTGSTKETFPQNFLPLTNQGWFIANIITWFFTGIGAIGLRRINKKFFYLVLFMFIISHLSFFIAMRGMVGVHALGAYQNTIIELFQLPLIAAGVYELVRSRQVISDYLSVHRKDPKYDKIIRFTYPAIAALTVFSISFIIITSQTIETRFTNITQGEVDAVRFVAKTGGSYAMISDLNVISALYAYSDGKVDGGGFRVTYIPGVSVDVRSEFYLSQLLHASSVVDVVEQARREANVCTVYIVIPSYFGLDENGLKRIADNLGDPLFFGSEGGTKLFISNC